MTISKELLERIEAHNDLQSTLLYILNLLYPRWIQKEPKGVMIMSKRGMEAIPSYFNKAATPSFTIDSVDSKVCKIALECFDGCSEWDNCYIEIPSSWLDGKPDDPELKELVSKFLLEEERQRNARKVPVANSEALGFQEVLTLVEEPSMEIVTPTDDGSRHNFVRPFKVRSLLPLKLEPAVRIDKPIKLGGYLIHGLTFLSEDVASGSWIVTCAFFEKL